MRIHFEDISDTLKDKLKTSNPRTGRDFVNPQKHWFFGLTITTTIFLFSAIYIGVDFYIQFANPESEVLVDVAPLQYRDKDVVLYATIYDEREAIFNALRAEITYVPPPIEIATSTEEVTDDENATEEAVAEDRESQ